MIQLIQIVLSIAAIIVAFSSRIGPWLIIALPLVWFSLTALALKWGHPKPRYIDELSPAANRLLKQWFWFYAKPFAGTDFSAASSTISLTAPILTIIGCFYGFYIGIIIGLVVYFYSCVLARVFNPTNFIADPQEKLAHAEVCEYMEYLREVARQRRQAVYEHEETTGEGGARWRRHEEAR